METVKRPSEMPFSPNTITVRDIRLKGYFSPSLWKMFTEGFRWEGVFPMDPARS